MGDPNNQRSCDIFKRDDAIQNVHTQMINWHGPTGTVFSVDIQHQQEREAVQTGRQRVATGGADSKVQIWELVDDEDGAGCVEHLSELNRHDCAVNVVRFHPVENILASASDDRCLFIWKLSDNTGIPDLFDNTSDTVENEQVENRETWTVIKQMRGHGSEVYDLAWSPNARYIVSGTMDNTSYVWDTGTCRKVSILQHHKGYVQGVAWDPSNEYITTVSSDRSAIVYSTKKFTPVHRISKIKSGNNTEGTTSRNLKIFLDTGMVDTFFRRPGFSPDGKLVAYPCGCYELENEGSAVNAEANSETEDKMIQINVVYIYQVNDFESPVLCLPTGNSPAIAVRFCPQLFKLRAESTSLFKLPYRMVYAVITLDNVLFYDSQQLSPFACISSIHYEQLTDASWSKDGKYFMVSSIDGFCTIVNFDKNKFGEVYADVVNDEFITLPGGATKSTSTVSGANIKPTKLGKPFSPNDSEMTPDTPVCDSGMTPDTPVCDSEMTPDTPVCDSEMTPDTPVCDFEMTPDAPVCDSEMTPDTPVCDSEMTPDTAVCDSEMTPDTPVCDSEMTPDAPVCDSEMTPDTPLCDSEMTPDTPVCDSEMTPDAAVCDSEMTPDTSVCDSEMTPDTPVCDSGMTPDTPVCDSEMTPDTPVCDSEMTPDTPVCDSEMTPDTPVCDSGMTPTDVRKQEATNYN